MDAPPAVLLRTTADRKLAAEWELVLLAQGITPGLRPTADGVELYVRPSDASRAHAALAAYDEEHRRRNAERAQAAPSAAPLAAGLISALVILVMFWVTAIWFPAVPWFERGGADSGRILQGELWRAVTALTLHADVVHAASNAASAAIFFGMVSSLTGWGAASALILLAGAGGNLLNAAWHGSPHAAVGASTAIFGAVGLLAGVTAARHRRDTATRRRAWLPIAAALALLGMLGTGGVRVDIWAHLAGLLVGGALGLGVGYRFPGISSANQFVLAAVSAGVLALSWLLALS